MSDISDIRKGFVEEVVLSSIWKGIFRNIEESYSGRKKSVSKGLEVWNDQAHSGNVRHLEWLKCYRLDTGTVEGTQ